MCHSRPLGVSPGVETYRIATIETSRGRDCARVHAASFDAAWTPSDFELFLGAGETIAHGAIDLQDDSVIGIVLSRVARDEAELLTLAVAPPHRRHGLARCLLAAHLDGLAGAGVAHLFLEVDTGNAAARDLYVSFGFAEVGERKAYYRSGRACPSAALVMRLDLPQDRSIAAPPHESDA